VILLVRVDERLIHGQVTVAWRGALDLDAFAVVDDELAGSDWEKDLVLASAPEGTAAEVVTVTDAVRLGTIGKPIPAVEWSLFSRLPAPGQSVLRVWTLNR